VSPRIDRLLSRLTRVVALTLGSNSWALRPDTPMDWPRDLPALPEDLERALQWRSSSESWRSSLYLPTLVLSSWQECAEYLRAHPQPGRFPVSKFRLLLDERGIYWADEPIADDLPSLIELEVLIHERLPASRVRRLRVQGPLQDWQPCPAPDEALLASCEPGAVLCGVDGRHTSYALKLADRLWFCDTGLDTPPDEEYLVYDARGAMHKGALSVRPILEGESWWRSALRVWSRPPIEQLLQRLGPSLPPEVDLDPTLPANLRALWQHTGGTDGPLLADRRLLGPSMARAYRQHLPRWDLLPLLTDQSVDGPELGDSLEYGELVCVDTQGAYGPVGALVRWRPGNPDCSVLHESLEDWLETCVLQRERGEDDLEQLTSPGCPRDLPMDWTQQAGVGPPEDEPDTLLSQALHLLEVDPRGRALMDAAADALVGFDWGEGPLGPPGLQVLRDWLADQGAVLGTGSAATLVCRLAPLLDPP
jgi:hypothetical protein